jgi:stearoyl-CoA desaturase (delta-9 desaturase)
MASPMTSATSPAPQRSRATPRRRLPRLQLFVTAVLVFGPMLVLGFALVRFWGHGVGLRDVILAVGLYVVVGHGVTIGFHRLLAHRSFEATRPL